MIIKNNFNSRNSNPLKDYNNIGKGSHSLDRKLDDERHGFIRENMENDVLRDLREPDNSNNDDDISNDKWDFFR